MFYGDLTIVFFVENEESVKHGTWPSLANENKLVAIEASGASLDSGDLSDFEDDDEDNVSCFGRTGLFV